MADSTQSVQRHCILGTAGHIDHGKTSLVRALTGIDTDRLPEEKKRGMTIDLGFAHLVIGETEFGIVDVPGHERFVKTMVAGATGIDVALMVVAADDSVMPQTMEHLEILRLLGVSRGVVAVTKIDMVDAELVEFACEEVSELLAETPLKGSAICRVSSTTGEGIEPLKSAIAEAASDIHSDATHMPFRMAVDRVFSVAGRGTVVTGSSLSGKIATGDTLEVHPGAAACRVRDLQSHGTNCDTLGRGRRVAINLSGIERERVERGVELATPGYLQPSNMLDVRLQCLPSHAKPLKNATVVRLGVGTVEVPVRVVLYGQPTLPPGGSCYAQLRCGQTLATTYGQRLIIRNENATRTIGGGVVLSPRPRRRHADAAISALTTLEIGDDAARVEQVLSDSRFAPVSELQMCAQSGVPASDLPALYEDLKKQKRWSPIRGTDYFVTPATLDEIEHRLIRWLTRFHESHADEAGRHVDAVTGWLGRLSDRSLARPLLKEMVRRKTVKHLGQYICLAAFAPELSHADERLLSAMIDEIQTGRFQPPSLDTSVSLAGIDNRRRDKLSKLATALGEMVQIDGKLFLTTANELELKNQVARLIEANGGVTVAMVRESLDSSRKYVVPFLEYLDKQGFTQRNGDERTLTKQAHEQLRHDS